MTYNGGSNNQGVVFRINTDGTGYSKLLDFDGINGANPEGSLILSGNVLYGMTSNGGIYYTDTMNYNFSEYDGSVNGFGTIFKIDTDGSNYIKLHDFDGVNGIGPSGTLCYYCNQFYGFATLGGINATYLGGAGIIFRINTDGSGFTKLYDFDVNDGQWPEGSPILAGNDAMFGMTDQGGSVNPPPIGFGVIFSFKVPSVPLAGKDSAANTCKNQDSVVLRSFLVNSIPGGSWKDLDKSGALNDSGIFNATLVKPGTYHFRYVINSFCGKDSANLTMNVYKSPDAGNDTSISVCVTGPPLIIFTYLGGNPDPGGFWTDLSNSNALSGNLFTPSKTQPGMYDLEYTLNKQGCRSVSSILKIQVGDTANAGLDSTGAVCNKIPSVNMNNFLRNAQASGTWIDPSGSGGLQNAVFNPSVVSPGIYKLIYIVTTQGLCVSADSSHITLIVAKPSIVNSSVSDVSVCNGTAVNITITPANNFATYVLRDSATGDIASAPVTADSTGNTFLTPFADTTGSHVYLVCSSIGGTCPDTLINPAHVVVYSFPKIISAQTVPVSDCSSPDGSISVLVKDGELNNIQYSLGKNIWQTNPVFQKLDSGYYTIFTKDMDGHCPDSINNVFVKYFCLNIPNLFTPNGDGKNDTWDFFIDQQFPEAIVEVYNRWGQKVYESSKGYLQKWDGQSMEGKDLFLRHTFMLF